MIAVALTLLLSGVPVNEPSELATLERYRAALNDHDIEVAMSLLSKDFTLQFEGTDFVLSKSDLRQALGWDAGVEGRVEWTRVEGADGSATFEGRESNDFFGLLGIEELRFTTTYWLDEEGKILKQSYRQHPGQPSWEEAVKPAVEWATRHRPGELQEIYPDGRIAFTEDMGRRWVRLLREWRASQVR